MRKLILLFVITLHYFAVSQDFLVNDAEFNSFPNANSNFIAFNADDEQRKNLSISEFGLKEYEQIHNVNNINYVSYNGNNSALNESDTPEILRSNSTLRVTYPNGGEVFLIGTETLITWEGVAETDTVRLYYSIDNGVNWNLITKTATGLKYLWKNLPTTVSYKCLVRVQQKLTRRVTEDVTPKIEWQKYYGGSIGELATSFKETADSGYIVAGDATSSDGNVSGNYGETDSWIVKLDSLGKLEWENHYGGSDYDHTRCIVLTADGGYIIAGSTYSDDYDIQVNKGENDLWVFKINKTGGLEWSKTYGGSEGDEAYSIVQTEDGGYIVAGYTYSDDGDVSGNKSNGLIDDYWVLKLNSMGEIEWQNNYGGKDGEEAQSVLQTEDGGYLVAGRSNSVDQDITDNKGSRDAWVLKLSSKGKIEWQKNYGGSGDDGIFSMIQSKDKGFVLSGYTSSNDGDITKNNGDRDYWILKINQTGEIEWSKTYGGSSFEYSYSIQQTFNDGYIVGGFTTSNDGDVTDFHGGDDYWALKLNSLGEKVWQKTIGGAYLDICTGLLQVKDSGYVAVGYSNTKPTHISDYLDFYIVKLSLYEDYYIEDISDSVFAIVIPTYRADNIDMKQCLVADIKDSVITPFFSNIGKFSIIVDSITITGSDAPSFEMLSGIPQNINSYSSYQAEFRFVPVRVGIHSAVINIYTQYETIKINIIGEGIKIKPLQIISGLLDFGAVPIGLEKIIQDTVLVRNISQSEVTIKNVTQLGPDFTQFEVVDGGGSFTLQPNEVRKLSVKFKPLSYGKTSGQLGFEYEDYGSPAKVQLFGNGVHGSVSIADDSAFAGEIKNLKLTLTNINASELAQIATNFEVKIRFQNSILTPKNNNYLISADSIFLAVNGNIANDSVLMEIPVIAALGTTEQTSIDFEYFILKDSKGNPVDYDFETRSGLFKLLGICEEGGKRLFYSNGKAEILSVTPNPAGSEVTISLNTIEEGEAVIYIYNTLGMEVYRKTIAANNSGQKVLKLNTSSFANGVYYIKYQTPTYIDYQKLMIGK